VGAGHPTFAIAGGFLMWSRTSSEAALRDTISQLTASSWTGILASDEAPHTMARRHALLGLPAPTDEQTRHWREVLYTAPSVEEHLAGMILFSDDVAQCAHNGVPFTESLAARGIVVGVNGDVRRVLLRPGSAERVTKGLETLEARLAQYKSHGVRFAKWRAEYLISDRTPSDELMAVNARDLARFAAISQSNGVVPMIEPDILLRGAHSLAACQELATRVLQGVFSALSADGVDPRFCLLKVSMVTPGPDAPSSPPEAIGAATADVVSKTVPPSLPMVALLSGGQTALLANANLSAVVGACHARGLPQKVTFSFGRSLQMDAMRQWQLGAGSTNATRTEFVAGLSRATAALRRGKPL
jgi:fructose-bisphosphate aldolase, class I